MKKRMQGKEVLGVRETDDVVIVTFRRDDGSVFERPYPGKVPEKYLRLLPDPDERQR
jgi:hypothetical protein